MTDTPTPRDVSATFPLDLDTFIAGLDSPNHSDQSRRDWCRLFFRDMQRAALTRSEPDSGAGLDVELLHSVLADIGVLDNGTWVSFRRADADRIIAEYARLVRP